MATNVWIRGLSGRGFRVKDQNSSGNRRTVKEKVTALVDLDDPDTQLILSRERDNFIRVAGSGSTTAQIIALGRRPIRINPGNGTFTVTIATPAVFTRTAHGLAVGDAVVFSTTGALPTGLTAGTTYWVSNVVDANTFRVSATKGGSDVNTSGTQSGTHTVTPDPISIKAGSVASPAVPRTVNLDDANVTRNLRRQKRDWASSSSGSALNIRGITEAQANITIPGKVAATAILSSNGTVPADNDTVTVNNVTYRFKTTIAQANDVARGASSDAALDALVKAVNQTGVSGTDYFAGTVAPTGVTAGNRTGTGATGQVTFTAAATGAEANTFPFAKSSANLSVSGATFSGGRSVQALRKGATITVNPSDAEVFRRLRRHYRSWVEA
jgi:hypothetical protein